MSRVTSQPASKSVGRATVLLGGIVVMMAATVLLIVVAVGQLNTDNVFRPEIALPLVVITGVIALLGTLAIAAATFGIFDMADKSQALGLPAGSVQAVIALSLILIFAVVALYASSASTTKTFESTGLSAAEYKALPPGEVVASHRVKEEGETTYTVVRSVEDANAQNINTQLLTTVSTLVVAVAGFYFGSKSVQEGSRAALDAAAPTRVLSVVDPVSPHLLEGDALTIKLQSVPPQAQLRWSTEGDKEGQLLQSQGGTFIYTPGKKDRAGSSATLHFEQVDDPSVSASLLVNFPKGSKGDPKEPVAKKVRQRRAKAKTKQPIDPITKGGDKEPPAQKA